MKAPPLDTPFLLRQHGLRPDKRLGQNFLVDETALDKIMAAAEIHAGDKVLEIGAGVGNLTRHLAITAKEVWAIELDDRLIPALKQVVGIFPNVHIVAGDILKIPPDKLFTQKSDSSPAPTLPEGYLVVANIPYYITSAVIRHLLEANQRPRRLILTVQREVADRICARPGEMSLLALSVQLYGKPEIVSHILAGSFYPAPQVDSAIVRVDLFKEPAIPQANLASFFRLAKSGFSQKRKTLRNALAAGLAISTGQAEALLLTANIDPQRRAETLSLEEWEKLAQVSIAQLS